MNLMFWKKKPIADADSNDSADDLQGKPDGHAVSQPPSELEAHDQETSEDSDAETTSTGSARSKRRLIIGAAIGVLVFAAIGLAAWKIAQPSPKPIHRKPAVIKADTSRAIQPEPLSDKPLIKLPPIEHHLPSEIKDHQTGAEALRSEPSKAESPPGAPSQTEIEALKKRNIELQAQIEALRKQQPSSAASANPTEDKARLTSNSGGIAISNKNPKATAMSLKEAIEAMNASSGGSAKKPAK